MLARNGLLRSVLGSSRGTSPWSTVRRQYHQNNLVMIAPYQSQIQTVPASSEAIDDIFTFLRETHLLDDRPGCLTVVTTPEFWANGHRPDPTDRLTWKYGAGHPLTLEMFTAMVEQSRQQARLLPPGFLFVFGGVAVDTGRQLPDGKIVGANIGWIVETGPTGDFVLLNKANPHTVDGWSLSAYTPGPHTEGEVGPYNFIVTDPTTGEKHVITVYCCFDMIAAQPPERLAGHRLLVANNGGTPDWKAAWVKAGVVQLNDTVAVNESIVKVRGGMNDGVFNVATVPSHPWLQTLYAEAVRMGLGNLVLILASAVLGISSTKVKAMELGYTKVTTTDVWHKGLSAIVTQPRDFPAVDAGKPLAKAQTE